MVTLVERTESKIEQSRIDLNDAVLRQSGLETRPKWTYELLLFLTPLWMVLFGVLIVFICALFNIQPSPIIFKPP
jgi:hypothetical protein